MGAIWVSYGELCEVIGQDSAEKFSAVYGGVSFYIPKSPGESSPLYALLGREALSALSRVYGGGSIIVPNRRKLPVKEKVIDMIADGKSSREIALSLDVTERYVQSIRQQMPNAASGQLRLPL